MNGAPPRTQSEEIRHVPGAGTDVVIPPGSPGDTVRYWVEGEAFPRIVVDVPNFQVLTGDGTVAPVPLSTAEAITGSNIPQAIVDFCAAFFTASVVTAESYADRKIAEAFAAGSTTPAAPTALVLTPTTGQVIVAFTPGAAGGSAITSFTAKLYVVNPSTGALSPAPVTPVTDVASPLTLTGLQDGVTYVATVFATNANGNSPESLASAPFVPPAIAPGAPTIASLGTISGTSATLLFNPPASNGGAPITQYTVTATSSDGGTTRTATGAASPITVTSLSAGKTYTLKVKATNAAGTGVDSAASSAFVVGTAPATTVAKTLMGMSPGEPHASSVTVMKALETTIGRLTKFTGTYFNSGPGGVGGFDASPQWGTSSDPDTVDNGNKDMGFDSFGQRVQPVASVPLAFGFQGQSAVNRITMLGWVAAGTTDGTHGSAAAYQLASRNYLRDRNISTTVAVASNGVNVSTDGNFVAGTGVLTVTGGTAPNATKTGGVPAYVVGRPGVGRPLFVTLPGAQGVVKISFTGTTATTFTGCKYEGRAAVGGGTGAQAIATGGYVGSGTGPMLIFHGRFGWEFDGDWYPWSTHSDTGSPNFTADPTHQAALSAGFVATHKVVVDLHRSFGWDGFVSDLTCDPTWFQARELDVIAPLAQATTADGAAKYIDVLGLDFYDENWGVGWSSTTQTWTDPTAAWNAAQIQLQAHYDLAVKYGLRVAYGEWACKTLGANTGGDNPTFIHNMALWLNSRPADVAAPPAHTPGSVAYHIYFDQYGPGPVVNGVQTFVPTWAIRTGKPNALAQFTTDFGA